MTEKEEQPYRERMSKLKEQLIWGDQTLIRKKVLVGNEGEKKPISKPNLCNYLALRPGVKVNYTFLKILKEGEKIVEQRKKL